MSEIFKKIQKKIQIYRTFALLSVFVGLLFVSVSNSYVFARETSSHIGESVINKDNVISLVNDERIGRNLPPLLESELLDKVAQMKLENMLEEDYFAHTSPEGKNPWHWFFQSGYDFAYAGENLATEFVDVNKQHDAWMKSPKHKENILDERFTNTGVAIGQKKVKDKEVTVTVEVFATPQQLSATPVNFTPNTFEVPDELFRANNEKAGEALNRFESKKYLLASSGEVNKFKGQQNTRIRLGAWIFVSVLVILVFIVEYRIFTRKK